MTAARPPDGGCAAWLRVFAYALVCICTLGVQYAFSPLYALLLIELGSYPAETAFVGSLSTGLMDGLAIFSGIAIERYGCQRVCVAGSLLCAGGLGLAALCTRLWQLYLCYGVLLGIGCSLALFSAIMLMNRWFSRNLAVAHALGNMASSLLSLAFGPTATPIFASIGRRHAMLALSGFELVALLFCASLLTTPLAEPADSRGASSVAYAASTLVAKAEEAQADKEVADVVAEAEADEDRRVGSPFRAALRRPAVQLMLLAEAFYGLAGWIPVVHLVRLSMECGLSAPEANTRLTFLARAPAETRTLVPFARLSSLTHARCSILSIEQSARSRYACLWLRLLIAWVGGRSSSAAPSSIAASASPPPLLQEAKAAWAAAAAPRT